MLPRASCLVYYALADPTGLKHVLKGSGHEHEFSAVLSFVFRRGHAYAYGACSRESGNPSPELFLFIHIYRSEKGVGDGVIDCFIRVE